MEVDKINLMILAAKTLGVPVVIEDGDKEKPNTEVMLHVRLNGPRDNVIWRRLLPVAQCTAQFDIFRELMKRKGITPADIVLILKTVTLNPNTQL